jgi:ribosomal protein S18 acetylase RimI-like enzyme
MITIRTLENIDADVIGLLAASGYASTARYRVQKVETRKQTMISMNLVVLDQSYEKNWFVLDDDVERYRQVVRQELSLGAYDDGQLVGVAIAERRDWNRTLWVWEFHVAGTHKMMGIGRRLMDALADRASEAGLRVMVCETQSTNVPAIEFYRKVGFEVGGIDLSYYSNDDAPDGEVAVFMKRKLASR